MVGKLCVLFALLVGQINSFSAEPLHFKHLRVSDGLSSNRINAIVQDVDGFIWVGTDEGINRYDGNSFRTFPLFNSISGRSGNIVTKLFIDDQLRLWVCTADAGLFLYNPKRLTFESYFLGAEAQEKSINDIIQHNDGSFLVGFQRHPMLQFTVGGEAIYPSTDAYLFRHNVILHFFKDNNQSILAAPLGTQLVRQTNNQWELAFGSVEDNYEVPTINAFVQFGSRSFFGGWNNKVFQYDSETKKLSEVLTVGLDVADDETNCLHIQGNELWIGSRRSGLQIYNLITGEIKHFPTLLWDSESISSQQVNCFFKDRNNRVWIGTANGISIYDPSLFQFDVNFLPNARFEVNGTEKVLCVYDDEDKLFIGTRKGLYQKMNGAVKKMELSIPKLAVYDVKRDKYNKLWIGAENTLYSLNENNGELSFINTYHSFSKYGMSATTVFDIPSSRFTSILNFKLNNDDWLLASVYGYGFVAVNGKTRSGALYIPAVQEGADTLYENLIRKIHVDSEGEMWIIGYSLGVMNSPKFDSHWMEELSFNKGYKTQFHHYEDWQKNAVFPVVEQIEGLPRRLKAYDIFEFQAQKFYLSTYSDGLFVIAKKNNKWVAEKIPSPHQSLEGIRADSNGNIWIISGGGFDCYRPQLNIWQRFDYRDGFPEYGVSGDIYTLKNGDFLACGEGFFITFDPLKLIPNNEIPQVVFTSISVNNHRIDSLLMEIDPVFQFDKNYISFEFSALNYTNPEMNQFKYKLVGADDDWVNSGNRNFATYSDLSPGEYQFMVKGSNNHSVWNEDPTVFRFTIEPPFWQKKSFVTFLAASICLILIAAYNLRIGHLQKKQKENLSIAIQAQENERFRLAGELHDDLGTKMSTLKLYLNSLQEISGQETTAVAINQHAQELLDMSISDLRVILSDLSPTLLQNSGIIAAISRLVSDISKVAEFTIEFSHPEIEKRFENDKELAVFRVVQELLNNAMKHAECSNISLKMSYFNAYIEFTYLDDGVGLPPNLNSQGYGIRNIQQRLDLHAGAAKWSSAKQFDNRGTAVVINLPVTFI
ncbi:MAG: hypothetical protein GC193_06360 [Cryomorphaceae bacterium]|nr:hypothetical protein [Cryomorphaceae bacterium]